MMIASNNGTAPRLPVFDGHNDVLMHLHWPEIEGPRDFFARNAKGHIDLPRMREGGMGGGFFAIYIPPPPDKRMPPGSTRFTDTGYEVPPIPAIDPDYAQQQTLAVMARLFHLEAQAAGVLKVVRTAQDLDAAFAGDAIAAVLHLEGAEGIDPGLNALEVFYQAGLRSIGLVWSRPNAFGHGVPFRFPHSPDTGPGLTDAGKELVRACNRLGVMLDLAHLNAQGFRDVAARSNAPLVVTHACVHAISPSTRNLTDWQIDAVGASGGIIGVNFAVYDLRPDGKKVEDTPLEMLVRHVTYIADRIGIDHVAFGSDFDGTTIPSAIGDAAGLPHLVAALHEAGYDEPALRKITHENWLRVLKQTWAG
jgi:membrane dipeptidase